jgi:hypothetical protein
MPRQKPKPKKEEEVRNMANETEGKDGLKLGVKFLGESIVPGGSNYLEGDVTTGIAHTILGYAARSVFGLPGLLLVSANSLTKSVTGRNLLDHFGFGGRKAEPRQTETNQTNAQ